MTVDAHADLEIDCRSCGSSLLVPPHMITAQCPYCASTSIVERPPSRDRPDPSYALGFVVDHARAANVVRRWIEHSGIFARSDFKKASIEGTRGVYVPAYLYGAIARTKYSASIGENYTVTETYTTTNSKGRTVTRTRTKTKTEWRSLAGDHDSYIVDVLVTASNGIPNESLEHIEPFDLRTIARYTPRLLSGWLAEAPSMSRAESLEHARRESLELVGKKLAKFMPGDSHRELDYSTVLEDEDFDLVLLPVWTFAARYDDAKPPVRVLVNGQTGEVFGRVPLSALKISIAVLIGLGLIGIVVLIFAAAAG